MDNHEIDWRIAMEVMGWRLHEYDRPTYGGKVRTARWIDAASPPESKWVFCAASDPANTYPRTKASGAWTPSTDLGDAMDVMEHLRAKVHDDGTVSAIRMSTGGRYWTVMIDDQDAVNDSLPMAISLAALAWAEAKKGEQP